MLELLYTTDKKEKQNRQVICNMFGKVNSFFFLNTKIQVSSRCFLKRQLTIFPATSTTETSLVFTVPVYCHCQAPNKNGYVPGMQRLVSQFL